MSRIGALYGSAGQVSRVARFISLGCAFGYALQGLIPMAVERLVDASIGADVGGAICWSSLILAATGVNWVFIGSGLISRARLRSGLSLYWRRNHARRVLATRSLGSWDEARGTGRQWCDSEQIRTIGRAWDAVVDALGFAMLPLVLLGWAATGGTWFLWLIPGAGALGGGFVIVNRVRRAAERRSGVLLGVYGELSEAVLHPGGRAEAFANGYWPGIARAGTLVAAEWSASERGWRAREALVKLCANTVFLACAAMAFLSAISAAQPGPQAGARALAVALAITMLWALADDFFDVAADGARGWRLLRAAGVGDGVDDPSTQPEGAAPAWDAIVLRHVGHTYPGSSAPALTAVSTVVRRRTVTAIVGENGGGKSTFLDILAGLLEPQEGRVLLRGVDGEDRQPVGEWRPGGLRQEPSTLRRSVFEDVAIGSGCAGGDGRLRASGAEVDALLERVSSGSSRIAAATDPLELSGGQRRRVGLARAMLCPIGDLVILDELTAELDPAAAEKILDELLTLLREQESTVALATHDLSLARRADRILVLAGGCIVEEGSHDELIARPGGEYRRLFELQSRGFMTRPADSDSG